MATSNASIVFRNVIENFKILTKNPEVFLVKDLDQTEDFKDACKIIHDNLLGLVPSENLKLNTLRTLLIDGFDEEQIWQQIELKNKHARSRLQNPVSTSRSLRNGKISDLRSRLIKSTNELVTVTESIDKEVEINEESNNDETLSNLPDSDSEKEDSDYQEDSEKESEELQNKNESNVRNLASISSKPSAVDDKFFKLSNLSQFLRLEDLKEERLRNGELDEAESDEDDIDLFQDLPSGDELDESDFEDDAADDKTTKSKDAMYNDFFDDPEDISTPDDHMSVNDAEISNCITNEPKLDSAKTLFELQQENVNKQISDYEQSLLKPKPWQLTGEVDASKRPTDGLLQMETDFDVNAKPVIVQDKDLCAKMESMIIMTIKNKAYSDGVRQYKTNDELIAYKKEIPLDMGKSQKSLAQEYEEMFLKKQGNEVKEEDPKHVEIKKQMDSLFPELHALFSHIPKPAIPEVKIVSNLPTVMFEEVAPTSTSDATLLAPEEVKRRTGLVKGTTERTDTDRKRERRHKKVHQRLKFKKQGNVETKGKQSKKAKVESGDQIKSSKDFFKRLQDTVNQPAGEKPIKKKRKL